MPKTRTTFRLVVCAARNQCQAPSGTDISSSTHNCYSCGLRIHSHFFCGEQLDEFLRKHPNILGTKLRNGNFLSEDSSNETRTICFTCISHLVEGDNSNEVGEEQRRGKRFRQSHDEVVEERRGAGGKQFRFSSGKDMNRKPVNDDDNKDEHDDEVVEEQRRMGWKQFRFSSGKDMNRKPVNDDDDEDEDDNEVDNDDKDDDDDDGEDDNEDEDDNNKVEDRDEDGQAPPRGKQISRILEYNKSRESNEDNNNNNNISVKGPRKIFPPVRGRGQDLQEYIKRRKNVYDMEVLTPESINNVLVRIVPLLQLHSTSYSANSMPETKAISCSMRHFKVSQINCESC
jgi:hypothetical protein